MAHKINTQYGEIVIHKASQLGPCQLYKKFFKSKNDKEMLEELKAIVKKYFPNYSDKDISNLYSILSKSGCTYATMANVIMEQLGNDDEIFQQYFGYSLCNRDGTINYDKLMLDIFACISQMVELEIHRYDVRKYSSIIEAAKILLNYDYVDTTKASLDLFNVGWIGDERDENGMFVFKNKSCTNESLIGSYSEIALKLFNINDKDMDREKLEQLLKVNNIGYRFNYTAVQSKFSGLPVIRINNLKRWMNKFFESNNINLELHATIIKSSSVDYEEFQRDIYDKLIEGYSIDVCSHLETDVWMTDGYAWEKPTEKTAGHLMNFQGFDKDGNILVCSWGKTYMFPKEFYRKLEFMAIRIGNGQLNSKKRS